MMEKIYLEFKRISEILNGFIKISAGIMLIIMTIVVTIQIIFRIFFNALSFTEEISRYLLVWSSLFAASVAYKQGAHIAVTFLVEKFKGKSKSSMAIIINLVSLIFFMIAIFYGLQLINMQVFQTSPALLIPMRYVYLCIPISFSVMLFHSLVMLWGEVIGLSGRVSP
ncbi:MAG: TRAP transporter small permease [Atribacterota bacterium]|jgi:TRAP-type C4-dicarboxylate transport system permease small subunit|nr:TRAP transporter small permease [Atribacterota bacterium]MDD3032248.1 TRAP transporter small permease [Atribacterota bacterium]MDD3641778.1 TRAP transporter small permease [Atribacterota bacterium]MDD4288575.1 TRAP transporter small permease [Atribacterota bacterium]MDD5635823.1 TRAP transporter small permease [Atribacterota bacterium]